MPENPLAFPVIAENGLGHVSDGMTLRDYFAAHVLGALLAAPLGNVRPQDAFKILSVSAYAIADAMLAQREKGTKDA